MKKFLVLTFMFFAICLQGHEMKTMDGILPIPGDGVYSVGETATFTASLPSGTYGVWEISNAHDEVIASGTGSSITVTFTAWGEFNVVCWVYNSTTGGYVEMLYNGILVDM
jgi:hypothetical protein